MNIKGKTIILTGARRIGQKVALALAQRGANLAITYKDSQNEVNETVNICSQTGVKIQTFQADLSKESDIKNLVEAVKQEFGQIDGLVHMAANYPKVPLDEVTMENFTQTQQIIAGSALLLAKYITPILQNNLGEEIIVDNQTGQIKGKIIFFSDWSVLEKPYTGYLSYNMAKAGINSLTYALAQKLGPDITVNAIAPGPILRPTDLSDEENTEALKNTPLKRWGGSDEIAKAVVYLLESDFTTGVVLPIDGGRTIG